MSNSVGFVTHTHLLHPQVQWLHVGCPARKVAPNVDGVSRFHQCLKMLICERQQSGGCRSLWASGEGDEGASLDKWDQSTFRLEGNSGVIQTPKPVLSQTGCNNCLHWLRTVISNVVKPKGAGNLELIWQVTPQLDATKRDSLFWEKSVVTVAHRMVKSH